MTICPIFVTRFWNASTRSSVFFRTPPMMANLMTVSTVSRTEERLKQVKPIRVSIKDDASVEEIIQALTDICVDDIESLSHDSTKVTTKYPGLIIVPERADLLESLITSINEAKMILLRQ